jgi:hypothetical protein
MRTSSFARARHAALLSIATTGVAMLLYPGGTALDRSTRGYSMSRNFLSDLGMTVAYDGRPNGVGALCFATGLCVLVLGLGGALAGFLRRYAVTPAARRFAWATGAVGLLACAAFVGVALTPEDRAMGLHVRFTIWASDLLPVAALLLALAAHASRVVPRRVVSVWAALGVALAAYAALLQWGPPLDTPAGLTTYVVAQKLVAVALLLGVAHQSVLAERAMSNVGAPPRERTSRRG